MSPKDSDIIKTVPSDAVTMTFPGKMHNERLAYNEKAHRGDANTARWL